jgi:hypothetical protein
MKTRINKEPAENNRYSDENDKELEENNREEAD